MYDLNKIETVLKRLPKSWTSINYLSYKQNVGLCKINPEIKSVLKA